MYINNNNIRKKNFFTIQRELIKKKENENLEMLKLFQDVKIKWNSTCHMLIRALILKKTLQRYHEKHEAEYLRLFDMKWSQMKYLIDLIKLFCVFIKRIDQFKSFTIHQVFEIYDKLFDHLDWARVKLSRKKIAWKKIMLKELIAANAKLRQYYAKTQESLNHLYEKTILLTSNKKDAILQEFNWKVFNDEISWSEVYWSTLEDQFKDEYFRQLAFDSREQSILKIDDLNILLNLDTSFKDNDDEFTYYRKRDNFSLKVH